MVRSRARARVASAHWFLVVALVTSLVAGCGATEPVSTGGTRPSPGSPPATEPAVPVGQRPSSSATLRIVRPERGAKVRAPAVHVVLDLEGGRIVDATTTDLHPDEGHVHLYLDNALVSMNYALEQDLELSPGVYVIKAEFVAADHAPFSPRVWAPDVLFTVR